MKNIKWIAAVLAVVMCLGLFAGCGKQAEPAVTTTVPAVTNPTTEPATEPATVPTEPRMDVQTLLAAINAEDAPKMTGADIALLLEIAMNMPELGMKLEMGMDLSGQLLLDWEPARLYAQLDMEMSVLGEKDAGTMEAYGLEENGDFLLYTYDPEMEIWSKEALPLNVWKSIRLPQLEDAQLQEQTEAYRDMECYVLSTLISPEQLQTMLGGELTDSLGATEQELNAVSAQAVLYVEKETLLLRGVVLDVLGIDELMGKLMEGTSEDMGGGVAMEIPAFRVEFANIRYDAQEVPQLSDGDRLIADAQNYIPPQDPTVDPEQDPTEPPVVDDPPVTPGPNPTEPPVVDDPVDPTKPPVTDDPGQSGEGETVSLGQIAFYVTVPDGLRMDYTESNGFSMSNDAMTASVVGTVYRDDGATLEDIVQTYVQLTELILGIPVSSGSADSVGGHETMYYSAEGVFAYMTWIHNGDGYLLLEVVAQTEAEALGYLQQIVAAIEVL